MISLKHGGVSVRPPGSSLAGSSRENVEAKQPGHHVLSIVAQIVDPDDVGPQVQNELVRRRVETTCFDTHAVAHPPRNNELRLQGTVSTRHP